MSIIRLDLAERTASERTVQGFFVQLHDEFIEVSLLRLLQPWTKVLSRAFKSQTLSSMYAFNSP